MNKDIDETFEDFVQKVCFALKFDYYVDVKLQKIIDDELLRATLQLCYKDFNAEETALLIACDNVKTKIKNNERKISEEMIDRISILGCYLKDRGRIGEAFFNMLDARVKEVETMMVWRFAKNGADVLNAEPRIDCEKSAQIDSTLKSNTPD